jgi:predicted nuclease with TOPRIM domain
MSNIDKISVSNRLDIRTPWVTLSDLRGYCNRMADMIDDFISEIESLQGENEDMTDELEQLRSKNADLQEELKELKSSLD